MLSSLSFYDPGTLLLLHFHPKLVKKMTEKNNKTLRQKWAKWVKLAILHNEPRLDRPRCYGNGAERCCSKPLPPPPPPTPISMPLPPQKKLTHPLPDDRDVTQVAAVDPWLTPPCFLDSSPSRLLAFLSAVLLRIGSPTVLPPTQLRVLVPYPSTPALLMHGRFYYWALLHSSVSGCSVM